jgi:hypothetical protein
MTAAHAAIGALALALSLAAGAWGAWRWYRVEPSRRFWPLLRAAQLALALAAIDGGILWLGGERDGGDLHVLYGVLPLLVMFFAEQLRVGAAEAVLAARGLESAQAVGRLPEREQRSVVVAILRREMGVMAAAALVSFALALRAASTAGWL